MPRPKKAEDKRRKERVEFRLTTGELEELTRRAEGMTVSDYLRSLALNSKVEHKGATPEREALIKAFIQINRLGVNINQISKSINTQLKNDGRIRVPDDVIVSALCRVQALADAILNELNYDGQRKGSG